MLFVYSCVFRCALLDNRRAYERFQICYKSLHKLYTTKSETMLSNHGTAAQIASQLHSSVYRGRSKLSWTILNEVCWASLDQTFQELFSDFHLYDLQSDALGNCIRSHGGKISRSPPTFRFQARLSIIPE